MAVRVYVDRNLSSTLFAAGDSWSIDPQTQLLVVRDEGGEPIAVFVSWLGACKED